MCAVPSSSLSRIEAAIWGGFSESESVVLQLTVQTKVLFSVKKTFWAIE